MIWFKSWSESGTQAGLEAFAPPLSIPLACIRRSFPPKPRATTLKGPPLAA